VPLSQPVVVDAALVNDSAYVRRVIQFLKRNEESFSRLAELTGGDFRFFFCRGGGDEASAVRILDQFPPDDPDRAVRLLSILLKRFQFQQQPGRHEQTTTNTTSIDTVADNNSDGDDKAKISNNNNNKWDTESLKQLADAEGLRYPVVMRLLRLALIDSTSGPPIQELMEFFSAAECARRLRATLDGVFAVMMRRKEEDEKEVPSRRI